jgi:hypothetical protein
MRPRLLLVVILPLLAALACNHELPTSPGQPNDPTAPSAAVFLGRTVDPNNTPVPNVTLKLMASDRIAATAISGTDGSFRIDGIAPNNYTILLRVNGREEQGGGLIRLLAGLNPHDVVVSICKLPYGTVRDAATGRPIAGAKVTIFYLQTVTDANGRYQLDFGCDYVPGSTIIMRAEHPDYEPSQTLNRASFLCTCAWDFLLTHR